MKNKCAALLVLFLVIGWVFGQDDGTISGRVTDSQGAGVAEATVLVAELQRTAVTQADGSYSIEVPAGAYTLLAAKSGYRSVDSFVTVTAGETLKADFEISLILPEFGQELVVLGSRAARTALETPVPVDVISSQSIEQTGIAETSRIIQFLAPSFNFSTSTISDGTDIVRPSTLRGLGPDQTLVLINGKRRHSSALVHVNGSVGRGSAGVDLNAIPSSAIERIEILRDGAAAQYGSDAIAGVMNIILKSQTEFTRVNFTAGQTYKGDGELFHISANRGWKISEKGYINLTVDGRFRGFTNRAGADPRQQYLLLSDGSPDPREATFDRINHRYGDAESDNFSFFFNSSIPLSEQTEYYFFGGFSQRQGESAGFYRRALDARNVPEAYPDGFLPLIETDVDDHSFSNGVRHRFGSWSMDASVTLGLNTFQFDIENSINASLGVGSPRGAHAGNLKTNQVTFNLDFFGSVRGGLPRPLNIAFGTEVRRDGYQIEAGEEASFVDGGVPDQFGGRAAPGIQVFPGFRPSNEVDASRSNVAAYVDVETHLSERFLLGLAGRFEHYTDVGSNVSGKVAVRYEFAEQFALRASVSNGFRAPSLQQANFNNTSTQFVFDEVSGELVPFEVGTFRNDSDLVRALGVPELEEETSINYSAGFTARPHPNLSLTADFFKIDIDDRIVVSGRFQDSNPDVAAILQPFGVTAAQFFSNAIDTETEGVDVVLAYFLAPNPSTTLSFTAAASWNRTDVVGPVQTPAPLAALGETLFDRIERERIEYAQPRAHYVLSGRYGYQRFAALARFNFFGNVKTVESITAPERDQVHEGKWLTDVEFSYRLQDRVTLAIGGHNIFDIFPDENNPDISFNGIFVYPRRTAPFGFNGGSWYTRVSFDF